MLLACGCTITEQQEIAMGQKTHAQFEKQFGGLYPDPQVQAYVNDVGLRMARYAERPNLPWQYRVVNSDKVNAFAVPGGYIYITQGLLFRLRNEAELASVLGHESGHIAHRHSVKQIQNAQFMQGAAFGAGIVGSLFGFGGVGDVASLVGQLSLMKYSRDQEKEADLTGLQYMSMAGYNPRAMVETMRVLEEASGGKGKGSDFLSTHPNPGNRMGYLSAEINKSYHDVADRGILGDAEFQSSVLARRR
jgi:predicted Zn-dependent protease